MARNKTSGEKPAKSQAGEGEPQAGAGGASGSHADDRGHEPIGSTGLPPSVGAGGLPLSNAIEIFASDESRKAAEELIKAFIQDKTREREDMISIFNSASNEAKIYLEGALKKYPNDLRLKWLLDSPGSPPFREALFINAIKSIGEASPDANERNEASKLAERLEKTFDDYTNRLSKPPDLTDYQINKLATILAEGLLTKLKSGQRIAFGRVDDAEHWSLIPASEWDGEWTFFDRSDHAERESPRMKIKDIRILRQEYLENKNNDTISSKRGPYKADWWRDILGSWVDSLAGKPIPTSLETAHYLWLDFHAIKPGDKDHRSLNQFKSKLLEFHPTIFHQVKAQR